MKIIIAGDIVPTKENLNLFTQQNFIEEFDQDFKKRWIDADYRIFNLESPLGSSEKLKQIKKSGPNLLSDVACINGIKSLKPDLVCLANNHILDYGEAGIKSTIDLLEKNKINYTGIISDNK